jgi:hypothetical protein
VDSIRTVRLIATCTDRKTLPAPDARYVRNLEGTPAERQREWIKRIRAKASETGSVRPARDLYCGEHWSVVLDIPDEIDGWKVQKWVASAGLGLIPIDRKIESYGATFSRSQEDSISRPGEDGGSINADWWATLTTRAGQGQGPKTIADLARANPDAPIVFAGSSSYVRPLTLDLQAASAQLANPRHLFLASVSSAGGLANYRIPSSDKLIGLEEFGGTPLALNARLARWVILGAGTHEFDPDTIMATAQANDDRAPERTRHKRDPMTTAELQRFIRKARRVNPRATYTVLLRELRDSGRACEQKKFKALFNDEVSKESRTS